MGFYRPGMESAALVTAIATVLTGTAPQYRRRPDPTPEQIAAAEQRDERQRWNDEVEARKAAKKSKGQP